MKLAQKLSAASLAAATYLTLALPAAAAPVSLNPCTNTPNQNFCPQNIGTVMTVVARAIYAIFIIAAIIALFFLIWGGIKWITSGGDKGKTESARNKITAAIVGLAIVASSYALMQIIAYFFGIKIFDSGIQETLVNIKPY